MQNASGKNDNNPLLTKKVLFMILFSLLILLLTWTWFGYKIRQIDSKIETLHKQ